MRQLNFSNFLHQSCVLKRPTITQNSDGTQYRSYSDITTVIGMLQPVSGDRKLEFGKLGINLTDMLYLDADVAITNGDNIYCGGKTYVVNSYERFVDADGNFTVLTVYLVQKVIA